MDYKNTLLLPETAFPMRGSLPEAQPKRIEKWLENGVYEKLKRGKSADFTLHDGPPYANGHLHIGHALNKTLKDIIVKLAYFSGKSVRFTPGWDCHGLPIEQEVEKALGKEKKDAMDKPATRELCRAHAKKFVEIQKNEFIKMGVTADFDKPYITMDYAFEANIYRSLVEIAKQGILTLRKKPVYWSWAARTALAEAEVEYKDKEDYSLFVAFELKNPSLVGADKASLIIWTTTPWTLPANSGISLNPDAPYALTTDGFVVAEALVEKLKANEVISGDVVKTFSAKVLERAVAINPLNSRDSIVVLGNHVMVEDGTGAVHTAPGHGEDDYRVGLVYDLPVIMPVDENGRYDETIIREKLLPEEFLGAKVLQSNEKIVEMLGLAVRKVGKFVHSYPHCWRTNQPVIYRATEQWFVSMDSPIKRDGRTLRQTALEAIDKVKFVPATGYNRLKAMIENRPDWCISRQRDWGVPIAFFRHKATGEVLYDEAVLSKTAEFFEAEGCDAWYIRPNADFGVSDEYEKTNDILDVWFDSGSTWYSVLKSGNYDAGNFPADVYLEGSDQHRGWFQSSLLVSCAVTGNAPYKEIITHGFTVDQSGQKMSKSKGNVVAPEQILKDAGGEILRLWVAMSDFTDDIKISPEILKQIGEQYRKLRNTIRFLLANTGDLAEISNEFSILDKWILKEAKSCFDEVYEEFKNYEFAKGFSKLNGFLTAKLSGVYLDICKDRLYCDDKNSISRKGAQSASALIAKSLITLVAPVLTHTMDEAIEHSPKVIKGDSVSIFDLTYEALPAIELDFSEAYWLSARAEFFKVVDSLKKAGKIDSTLTLTISGEKLTTELADWFLVSEVNSGGEEIGEFVIENDKYIIKKSTKHKCPRCWRYLAPSEDALCGRCEEVVK